MNGNRENEIEDERIKKKKKNQKKNVINNLDKAIFLAW